MTKDRRPDAAGVDGEEARHLLPFDLFLAEDPQAQAVPARAIARASRASSAGPRSLPGVLPRSRAQRDHRRQDLRFRARLARASRRETDGGRQHDGARLRRGLRPGFRGLVALGIGSRPERPRGSSARIVCAPSPRRKRAGRPRPGLPERARRSARRSAGAAPRAASRARPRPTRTQPPSGGQSAAASLLLPAAEARVTRQASRTAPRTDRRARPPKDRRLRAGRRRGGSAAETEEPCPDFQAHGAEQ